MATLLYRLARTSFRRRRSVAVLWLVLVISLGGAAAAFQTPPSDNFTIPGTESQDALDSLKTAFPEASGATGALAVAAPQGRLLAEPPLKSAVDRLVREAAALPGVVGAADPFVAGGISPDGRYGLIQVQFAAGSDGITEGQREAYELSGQAARAAGL